MTLLAPTLHACDYCETPTTRTSEDNDWDHATACDDCHDALTWQHEHAAADCEAGPPKDDPLFWCTRDHAAEAAEAHADLLDDMRREAA